MFLSSIISGTPRIMEPDKISDFGWYSFEEIEEFRRRDLLVPNLCSALRELEKYL